jgi:hypothetical protein
MGALYMLQYGFARCSACADGRKRCDQDLTGATEWRLIRVGV